MLSQKFKTIEELLAQSLPQLAHAMLSLKYPNFEAAERELLSPRGGPLTVHPQEIQVDAYGERSREAEIRVLEAWAWMEAHSIIVRTERSQASYGWAAISTIGIRFLKDADFRRVIALNRLRVDDLHPALKSEALENFWRGSFDLSVFAAMKAVEVSVRTASGLSAGDIGIPLMRKAFAADRGPLTDMNLESGERESVGHLFAGAIGMFKSPGSHRYVEYDADTCADLLIFASRLLRIVDRQRAAVGN